jgi:non-specific protein-tyrosine kinase
MEKVVSAKQNGVVPPVSLVQPRSPIAEAYRTLRTSIQFSSLDNPIRTLLVTSASPGDGKSTTLANLAIVTAEAGYRVIAVDCDLRRPTLHRIFGLSNERGLTSVILDEHLAEFPLQETGVQGLQLLASGPLPPNPSELLGSQRMARVIAQLKEMADLVLFDSPPVVVVTDAAVLAARLDGVVLVVSAGRTRRDMARRAKAQIEKVNARLLGVVLNNVRVDGEMVKYYGQ